MTKYKTIYERFWEKVNIQDNLDACWIWLGSIQKGKRGGYGTFWFDGKTRKAHQVSWLLTFGDIPTLPNADFRGTCVLHSCDNRLCVNPSHLFLGTNDDNMKDMVKKGRAKNTPKYGVENPNSKITGSQVREIRSLYSSGLYRQEDLGNLYGISQTAVGLIVRKVNWAWLK